MHSVAMCLLRQCVEALTLVDLGLQSDGFRITLLKNWKEGRRSSGEIRQELERNVWPRYGRGLWDENWAEFFSNLARSVHPFAHYSPELLGWQVAVRKFDGRTQFVAEIAPAAYDPLKASRITLLHSLIVWTLARLTMENAPEDAVPEFTAEVEQLRVALGSSKLLFKTKDWADELAPHVLFLPGHDWRDES